MAIPSVRSPATSRTLLALYLNDHHTAATGGLQVARRCAAANRGSSLGAYLEGFVREAEEDRASVASVLRRLGASPDRKKQAAAFVAVQLGRLKLNGQLLGYSHLSRLLELEALCAGVEAKQAMWRALQRLPEPGTLFADLSLPELIARAQGQQQALGDHRLAAAAQAFAGLDAPTSA